MTPSAGNPADDDAPSPSTGQAHIDALRSSVEHLYKLAAPLTEDQLTGRADPTDWTIAQVLSHLGSGAVIMQRQLEDAVAGQDTPIQCPKTAGWRPALPRPSGWRPRTGVRRPQVVAEKLLVPARGRVWRG